MISLAKLQSVLLHQGSRAVPVRIFRGIQGDHLSVAVRHDGDGDVRLLNSPIRVTADWRIQLLGTWSPSEAKDIHFALGELITYMVHLEREEAKASEETESESV